MNEDRYLYVAVVQSGDGLYRGSQPFTGKQKAIDWVANICFGFNNPFWGEVYKHAFHVDDRTQAGPKLVYEHK